jgi:hemolysin activation/secretion protein
MKYILLYLTLTSCLFSFAQNKAPDLPRYAVRGNVSIPKVVSSEAFRNSFSGVMAGDINVTYKLVSNFFVGVGYSYTYYKPQKAFRDQNINTNMQSQNGYLKLGIDKFFSANGFATFSLNAGFNHNEFRGIKYKSDTLIGKYPTQFNSSFVEPVIGLYFIVDPNFAIGGHLSYKNTIAQFNPSYPGMDKWFDYTKVKNNWSMSMITLGFGFYYGLVRK